MKRIFLFLVMVTGFLSAQQLTKNSDGRFEYIETVGQKRTIDEIKVRLSELGYKDLSASESSVSGTGYINDQVNGGLASFGVEMRYDLIVDVKEDRYRITVKSVHVKDHKTDYILEDMGRYQKKWLSKFSDRLPAIITSAKEQSKSKDW